MLDVKLGEAIAKVTCSFPLILGQGREAGLRHEHDDGNFAGYGKPDQQILNFDLDRCYGVFGPAAQEFFFAFWRRFTGGYPHEVMLDLVEFGRSPSEENWIQQIAVANLVVRIDRLNQSELPPSTGLPQDLLPAFIFSGHIKRLKIKIPHDEFRYWGVKYQSQLAPDAEPGGLRPVLAVGDQIEVIYRTTVNSGRLLGSRTPDGVTTQYSFVPPIFTAHGGTPSERPSILSSHIDLDDADC